MGQRFALTLISPAAARRTTAVPDLARLVTAPVDLALVTRRRAAAAEARRLEAAHPGERPRALTLRAGRRLAQRAGVAGAATGGVAGAPAVGNLAAAAAVTVDLGVTLAWTTELVMTAAALHGQGETETLARRRTWALTVLAGTFDVAGAPAAGPPPSVLDADDLSADARGNLHRMLVQRLVLRLGLRSGVASVGRYVPLGLGAAVGGLGNAHFLRASAAAAADYFEPLATPVAGHLVVEGTTLREAEARSRRPQERQLPVPRPGDSTGQMAHQGRH